MPNIRWRALPAGVKSHLLDRVRLRQITPAQLTELLSWINADPDVPDAEWCKDFGSFKLVGQGALPKTFLTAELPLLRDPGLISKPHRKNQLRKLTTPVLTSYIAPAIWRAPFFSRPARISLRLRMTPAT